MGTWFNQPGRKLRRRKKRAVKAVKVFPRPVAGLLRPVVQCPTRRYNARSRLGRGFTFEELKAAGVDRRQARSIGIAVDHRRKNRSEESLQRNVARLQEYKSKLVLYPRKAGKPKKGDATAEEIANVQQNTCSTVVPIKREEAPIEFRAITDLERDSTAFGRLRRERHWAKKVGRRAKRSARLAEAKKNAKPKKK